MKNNKLESPVEDRRQMIRREADKEQSAKLEIIDSETSYRRIFLTPGERKLLQDIYLSDFDDLE